MPNRIYQNIVYQMRDIIGREIGVIDEFGTTIVSSDASKTGESNPDILTQVGFNAEITIIGDYSYKPVGNRLKLDFIVFVEGTDHEAAKACAMLTVAMGLMKQLGDDKRDRNNFVKNVILDNILPGDIYVKAREMHFPTDVSRCAFLIRPIYSCDYNTFSAIQNLFPEKNKDFVINVNETDIAVVKEVRSGIESKELEKMAQNIIDTLLSESDIKVVVGIGSVVETIKDAARSFKEAQVALEVGKVFDSDKVVTNYENLGIGRLIYQLPTTLCEMFLMEVFKKGSIDLLDDETLFTIQKFFENNLNVSETSRKLFVHRNTLVYRLEKIRKITGLDLREFDHAIVFKIALMVKKYLDSDPIKY